MDRTSGHRLGGTAYEDLKDWLLDYYDVDVEIAAEYLYAAAHEN